MQIKYLTRESPLQFENRIMPRVYIRSIVRIVVLCNKKLHFVSRNWHIKISSVACGLSSIQMEYSDYPKSLISIIH